MKVESINFEASKVHENKMSILSCSGIVKRLGFEIQEISVYRVMLELLIKDCVKKICVKFSSADFMLIIDDKLNEPKSEYSAIIKLIQEYLLSLNTDLTQKATTLPDNIHVQISLDSSFIKIENQNK